ncbi:putative LysR family transcriptional regulator [Vitreoscilla sp. C1]|uniref:LysR family transcriptional regulator n=1 Tax=Vitreoscilla sp. (strain C1) TaxID=96942 RepID=UPI00148ECE68|nr:LysR family transcriptional regulator [Vitreoscilla sp. C1]QJQ52230.1 putative LysR family transcriptional regulator [Vitreoscilla sp. C1]
MQERLNNLHAFMVVAREQNITRAAMALGMSQASLSQVISKMEQQLGLKLLNRTTRSINLTEAGEQFITLIGPALEDIQQGLSQIMDDKHKPSGTIRIVADDFAIQNVLWPKLQPFLQHYPKVHLELISDHGVVDVNKSPYDAAVVRGDLLAKDMETVQVSAPIALRLVASPRYLENNAVLKKPQDLLNHTCINLRSPTQGGVLVTWHFLHKKKEIKLHVNGQLTFSNMHQALDAAIAGYGLAYLPEQLVCTAVEQGHLHVLLPEYSVNLPPYFIYYPTRLQANAGFTKLLDNVAYQAVKT